MKLSEERESFLKRSSTTRILLKEKIPCKIPETILEMRGTQVDQRTRKLITIHKSLHLKDDIDICQEKKEVEDSSALKIAWMHQYEDSNTILKNRKKCVSKAAGKMVWFGFFV